ncbi:cell division protein [Alphaproteobacteria bacterium]|nr:cell division protein [Alphaproteobacteria bacterium]
MMRFGTFGSTALPLEEDASTRYLPWLIAPQLLLCIIALTGAFILHELIGRWETDVSGTMTVEIAAPLDVDKEAMEKNRDQIDMALQILNSTPGVARARALSQKEMIALLSPWLGDSEFLREMPLPTLIDVTLEKERKPNLDSLSKELQAAVSGASLDDHRVWLSRLINLSRSIEYLALGVALLIGGATSLTVVFATRTGMAVHHEAIRMLHLIGATDDYIAREFANKTFILALKGALIGFVPALPLLVAIAGFGSYLEGGFLARLTMSWIGWLLVGITPLLMAILAMATARITVFRALAKML